MKRFSCSETAFSSALLVRAHLDFVFRAAAKCRLLVTSNIARIGVGRVASQTDIGSLGTLLVSLVRIIDRLFKSRSLESIDWLACDGFITFSQGTSQCQWCRLAVTECWLQTCVVASLEAAQIDHCGAAGAVRLLMPLRSTRSVREPHIDVSEFRHTWASTSPTHRGICAMASPYDHDWNTTNHKSILLSQRDSPSQERNTMKRTISKNACAN